jgi:hypothetical protein
MNSIWIDYDGSTPTMEKTVRRLLREVAINCGGYQITSRNSETEGTVGFAFGRRESLDKFVSEVKPYESDFVKNIEIIPF